MTELPAAEPPTRVLLVHDHEVVRRGLHDLIDDEPDMEVVGEASTAAQALARGLVRASVAAIVKRRRRPK